MADKFYNIEIGGEQIQIPAWASESTMLGVAQELEQVGQIDGKMLQVLSQYTKNSKEIIAQIDKESRRDAREDQQDAAANNNLTKRTKSFGRAVLDSTSFLGDTEAPITSLVKTAKEVGGPFTRVVKRIFGRGGSAESMGNSASNTADNINNSNKELLGTKGVISDATFMWLGWNAGKLESFAKVQQQMIDNGAIMFESSWAFEQLRRDVNRSGVTYDAFAKTIATNGSAISVFGGTTSLGTRRFQRFFKDVQNAGDNLGDFGLSNTELLQQTGEFLEYQRLTGGLNRSIVGLEDDLTDSFTKLQIETAGLASITGLTRSQVLQSVVNIDNMDFAAGLQQLEGDQKEAADEARKLFNLVETVGGTSSPLSTLKNALARGLAFAQGDLSKLNLEAQMAQFPEDLAALRLQFGDDFIKELENNIRDGNLAAVQDTMFDAMNDDIERFGTATGSVTDAVIGRGAELAGALTNIRQTFGKINREKLAEANAKASTALSEAGTSTQLINDAAAAFLTAQNAVTLPMNVLADTLKYASGGIKSAIDFVTGANNEQARESTPEEVLQQQREQTERLSYAEKLAIQEEIVGRGLSNDMLGARLERERFFRENATSNPDNYFFGGNFEANKPLIMNDGVDMRQAELTIPALDGRIMSNREVQEIVNGDLTNDKNSSIIRDNMLREYKDIVEAKRQCVAQLENLKRFTKAKIMDDRLKNAIDSSGA